MDTSQELAFILNRRVAQEVFRATEHGPGWWLFPENPSYQKAGINTLPNYALDMNEAWSLHCFMCSKLFSRRLFYLARLQYQTMRETNEEYVVAWPDVLVVLRNRFAEAICMAALETISGPII